MTLPTHQIQTPTLGSVKTNQARTHPPSARAGSPRTPAAPAQPSVFGNHRPAETRRQPGRGAGGIARSARLGAGVWCGRPGPALGAPTGRSPGPSTAAPRAANRRQEHRGRAGRAALPWQPEGLPVRGHAPRGSASRRGSPADWRRAPGNARGSPRGTEGRASRVRGTAASRERPRAPRGRTACRECRRLRTRHRQGRDGRGVARGPTAPGPESGEAERRTWRGGRARASVGKGACRAARTSPRGGVSGDGGRPQNPRRGREGVDGRGLRASSRPGGAAIAPPRSTLRPRVSPPFAPTLSGGRTRPELWTSRNLVHLQSASPASPARGEWRARLGRLRSGVSSPVPSPPVPTPRAGTPSAAPSLSCWLRRPIRGEGSVEGVHGMVRGCRSCYFSKSQIWLTWKVDLGNLILENFPDFQMWLHYFYNGEKCDLSQWICREAKPNKTKPLQWRVQKNWLTRVPVKVESGTRLCLSVWPRPGDPSLRCGFLPPGGFED